MVKDLVKLDSISSSLFDALSSDESKRQTINEVLTNGTNIAKKYGYDALAYDTKIKDFVVIKDGKKYYPDMKGNLSNIAYGIGNNFYDIALGFATGGAGVASFIGGGIDYARNAQALGMDTNATKMLEHATSNAIGSAAGTLVIGGAIKGGAKAFNTIKDIKNISTKDLKNIKVKNILDNEEMAINRKLSKFDKKEIDANYEAFKNIQSNTVISKDKRRGNVRKLY